MTNNEYRALNRISNSDLTKIDQNIKIWRQSLKQQSDSTAEQIFGTAFHCYLLEYQNFFKEYVISEKFDLRTKGGKEKSEQFAAENQGKTVISNNDYGIIIAMSEACYAEPEIKEILESPFLAEEIMLFDYLNVECKAKLDLRIPKELILDVKTTRDGNLSEMAAKSIANYKYYRQLAFYKLAAELATGEKHAAKFLFCSKEKPYTPLLCELSTDYLDFGLKEVERILSKYLLWEMGEISDSYEQNIIIDLPKWLGKD